MRDYGAIVERIEALEGEHLECEVLGWSEDYPIHRVSVRPPGSNPGLLMIAGTHGDEPAGVEAALAFLEQDVSEHAGSLGLDIIPCLNPYGYVRDTRYSRYGVDLNWAFDRPELPEVAIVRTLIRGRRFEAAIDLHEDWDSAGYYLYELHRHIPPIGDEVVRRVEPVCPVSSEPIIEGDPANAGVIHPDTDSARIRRRGDAIPINLYLHHTDHLITSETPTTRPMSERVAAHRIAVSSMIAAHVDPPRAG